MRTLATLCAALSLASILGACARREAPPAGARVAPDEAARLLIDRNWLDRWPAQPSDRLHVYRFTPKMGGGVFQDRTLFEGHFELFTFQIHGEHLSIQWPHTDREDRMVFQVKRVKGPEPFDLELDLSDSSHGPRTYYGRSSETAADAAAPDLGVSWASR
jgi:hypothetical protein